MDQSLSARRRPVPRRTAQRGLVLYITLMALGLMTFASIALLRSVDTGTLIAGNLGFQATALASADAGTETSIAWLQATRDSDVATLYDDVSASGYYATSTDNCDLTGNKIALSTNDVNWTGTDPGADCNVNARILPSSTTGIAPGYTVAYVINRMCTAAGAPGATFAADGTTPMVCARVKGASSDLGSRSGTLLLAPSQYYYRITTRVGGPRNTVRFVQAFVVF